MADYKRMYAILFNKITQILEELEEIQRQTEEIYIESSESESKELDKSQTNDSDENPPV